MAKQKWWRRLLGGQEPVENRTAGSGWQIVIDGQSVWFPASVYRGGMSIPGAWRSANLIADLLGGVPWEAFRKRGGSPVELIEPTPWLLRQPAPPDTRMTTFSSWSLDLVWHGNAIGIIADRDSSGYATAVYPVPAEQVGVRRVTDSTFSPLPIGEIEYNIGSLRLGSFDVVHIKGPCAPGAVRGLGVLECHMDGTLNLAQEQARQAGSIANHGVPTGVIKSMSDSLTSEKATELKTAWLTSQRERTVAVLNATTEFQPLSWNPEQLQLVEARKFTLHELALIFGVPLSFLGVEQSSRTYSNVEQESLNLLKYTLGGHLARFEQTLSQQFPEDVWVKANLDSVLRADTKTRYEAHAIALQNKFILPSEVRDIEDRPAIPGLDEKFLAEPASPAPAAHAAPAPEEDDDAAAA